MVGETGEAHFRTLRKRIMVEVTKKVDKVKVQKKKVKSMKV
jgi:hypothetical protein